MPLLPTMRITLICPQTFYFVTKMCHLTGNKIKSILGSKVLWGQKAAPNYAAIENFSQFLETWECNIRTQKSENAPWNITFFAGNAFLIQTFSDVTTRCESHTLPCECDHCNFTSNISLFWNDTENFDARFQEDQLKKKKHTLSLSCPYPCTKWHYFT